MKDLGRTRLKIHLQLNGDSDDVVIEGGGYRWDAGMAGSGLYRVRVVLQEYLTPKGIKGSIVSEVW
jgi:hypothetical protein